MSLRFVQITDHHLVDGDLLSGFSTESALRRVLQHIVAHAGPLDFIISTGDLTERGSASEYQTLLKILGAERGDAYPGPLTAHGSGLNGVPVYVLPGNHDQRPELLRNLFPTGPTGERLHGWFEYRGVRFICVDWGPQAKATSTPELQAFLAAALAGAMPAVIFMHHHVAPMGYEWLDRLIADDVAAFAGWISGRRVLALFSGHAHATFENQLAGIPVYGLRATCFQFALHSEPLRCLLPPHYRIVTIEQERLTTEIVEVPL